MEDFALGSFLVDSVVDYCNYFKLVASLESHFSVGLECTIGNQLAVLIFSNREMNHYFHRMNYASLVRFLMLVFQLWVAVKFQPLEMLA